MVAASAARSQVSPDYLQATPRLALRPFSRHKLGISLPILALESEPCHVWQDNAASRECCRKPTAAARPYLDAAVMVQAKAITAPVPGPHADQIAQVDTEPADYSQAADVPRDRQQQEQDATDRRCDKSGKQDNAPQEDIRVQFGRV